MNVEKINEGSKQEFYEGYLRRIESEFKNVSKTPVFNNLEEVKKNTHLQKNNYMKVVSN